MRHFRRLKQYCGVHNHALYEAKLANGKKWIVIGSMGGDWKFYTGREREREEGMKSFKSLILHWVTFCRTKQPMCACQVNSVCKLFK